MSLKKRTKVAVEQDIETVKEQYIQDVDKMRAATGMTPLIPLVEEMEREKKKQSVVIIPTDDKANEDAVKKLSTLRAGPKKRWKQHEFKTQTS